MAQWFAIEPTFEAAVMDEISLQPSRRCRHTQADPASDLAVHFICDERLRVVIEQPVEMGDCGLDAGAIHDIDRQLDDIEMGVISDMDLGTRGQGNCRAGAAMRNRHPLLANAPDAAYMIISYIAYKCRPEIIAESIEDNFA